MSEKSKKKKTDFVPPVTIGGPGVVSVRSSDILKTDAAQQQIEALRSLKESGVFSSK